MDTPLTPGWYTRFPIQPLTFIAANHLDFLTGNVIKYVCRHDARNGVEDLEKARVYLDALIERARRRPDNAAQMHNNHHHGE